jgi:parallel beta-helix repeat protein
MLNASLLEYCYINLKRQTEQTKQFGKGKALRKIISGTIITLLVFSVFPLASIIQPVKAAGGTVYIRADGSVDPSSAPILNVGNVSYTFTAAINGSLVVERDNIVVDGTGHVLEGAGTGAGIDLSGRSNVTIKSITIRDFWWGVFLSSSSGNTLYANRITNNTYDGIYVYYSSGNSISANTITNSTQVGIWLYDSSGNSISANNVTSNVQGLYFYYSYNNSICANTMANNKYYGIRLEFSSSTLVCHNNFVGNTVQAEATPGEPSAWDDGYPSGGNYWSDLAGVDLYSGPYQNETGSDGIGDTPYVIDASNVDHYPLIGLWNPTLSVESVATWYWTSATTINSAAIGDVDGDGQKETVTGGTFYDGNRNVAQLVVWNSSSLAPERLTTWYWTGNTTINSVALGDVNGDGQTEIVTGGYYYDGARQVAQLVVWNGSNLAVEQIKTWYWAGNTVINSVALGDVDADGQVEIITGGYFNDGIRNVAQLVVWNGSDLSVDRLTTWYWTGNTVINSVALGDVDTDGQVEIITGGTFFDGTRDVAQLVVWNGSSLAVDRLTSWYWTGNTVINSVAVGDVDADGQTEIVTGGYYNDGTRNAAQLVVWTGLALTVKRLTAWYWTGNTVINSVALGDVDADGHMDIVTGGYYNDGTRNAAQLVAWNGSSLAVENVRTWYWVSDTSINSVCLSDINGDLSAEIVTGAAYENGSCCIAQLVVWGMRQTV